MQRRLGCLAGCLIFPLNPELITLTPNQLKRMLKSKNIYEIYAATGLAAAVCNREIAIHMEEDVERLLKHSKSCVRKGGCALARKLTLSSLEAGKKLSGLLIQSLKDNDITVLISASGAILDCALVYPHLFVNAIPILFGLLDHKNNWLIIKALQALCALLDFEKRLYTKLAPKLLQLLNKTDVISLESEIHKQVAMHFSNVGELIEKTKDKVMNYLESSDPNIRYMGLIILRHLLKAHRSFLILYKDKLLQMLSFNDKTIKLRVLEILSDSV